MNPRRDSAAPILPEPAEPTRNRAIPEDDPVWQAILRAPVITDPELCSRERAAERAALEELAAEMNDPVLQDILSAPVIDDERLVRHMTVGARSVSQAEITAMIQKKAEEAGELEEYEATVRARQAG